MDRKRNSKTIEEDFDKALPELLKKRNYRDISVSLLCQKAGYPRSTFYNHYRNYENFLKMAAKDFAAGIDFHIYKSIPPKERTIKLFSLLYDYLLPYRDGLQEILVYNRKEELPLQNTLAALMKPARQVMEECPDKVGFPLPYSLVVDHYLNTVSLLIQKCFFEREPISKQEALKAVDYFLCSLERAKMDN